MCRHQSAGKIPYINIGNKTFENLAKLKYFEITLANQNYIQEDV
jgi:hypothetical protein